MAKQPEKTTSKSEASPEAREAPVLKASALKWQSEGYAWREALVRLPDGMLLDDLISAPEVWKNIQAGPQTSLRRFDRVTLVSFSEDWVIRDALVVDADQTRVVLALKPSDRIVLPSKAGSWTDGQHVIRWAGSGFACFRTTDGVQIMPQYFATLEAARAELIRQMPRQVA